MTLFSWPVTVSQTATSTANVYWVTPSNGTSATNSTMSNAQLYTSQIQQMMAAQQAGMMAANPGPMRLPFPSPVRLPDDWRGEIELPGGAKLIVHRGAYQIEDKDAKVTYRAAPVRDFNRFLNAGDLLQDFIADLGKAGARQSEILSVPIELFINWIILKAAEQDQDKPAARLRARCRWCSRFIAQERARAGIMFCGEKHAVSFLRRAQLA